VSAASASVSTTKLCVPLSLALAVSVSVVVEPPPTGMNSSDAPLAPAFSGSVYSIGSGDLYLVKLCGETSSGAAVTASAGAAHSARHAPSAADATSATRMPSLLRLPRFIPSLVGMPTANLKRRAPVIVAACPLP